jgi:hypothetical protein
MDNKEGGKDALASHDVHVEDVPLTDFDSLATDATNLSSHGFEWRNSDFCSSAVNLKSVTNTTMSVHDEYFDVDNIDPASVLWATMTMSKCILFLSLSRNI